MKPNETRELVGFTDSQMGAVRELPTGDATDAIQQTWMLCPCYAVIDDVQNPRSFWNNARTNRRFDRLIDMQRNFCPGTGDKLFTRMTDVMHSRPSFIRLSLTALSCSQTFAHQANDREGYAPASDKNRRI